jgi:hypothetical protein
VTFKEVPHPVNGQIYSADQVKLWLEDFASKEQKKPSLLNLAINPVETTTSVPEKIYSISSSQIWAAFWMILSLAIIMATIILVLTTSRLMFRYQSNRSYTLATAGEGTKILSRVETTRRYM